DSAYAAMCRHYCEALHDTNVYACVNGGGDPTGCEQSAPAADWCYQLRCEPMLVQASLCFTQCTSLRSVYDPVCSASVTPAGLCPASPSDHDLACRAGCGPVSE